MEYTFRPIERWPREWTKQRKRSPFAIGYRRLFDDLGRELRHLGVRRAVIQLALSESEIRLDGQPRAGARPAHPGVILTFERAGHGTLNMPCDTYADWLGNLRAISLSLTALRAVDRYGVTRHGEQYRGWAKLPPPGGIVTPPPMTLEEAARFVAGQAGDAAAVVGSADTFRTAYRMMAARLHPDANGGQHRPEWSRLQQAHDLLRKHHSMA